MLTLTSTVVVLQDGRPSRPSSQRRSDCERVQSFDDAAATATISADVARLILIVVIVFALLLVARVVRGVPPKGKQK
jgi:hypothetical protein